MKVQDQTQLSPANTEVILAQMDAFQKALPDILQSPLIGLLRAHFSISQQDAEDALQTALFKAWKFLQTRPFPRKNPSSEDWRTWVAAIARNTMIDILRYRQRREILYLSHPINEEGNTLQEALEEMADTQTPEESFIKREMLQGALYELSPLLAHYLWGYALASSISKETCQTYAQHTDIPANTAKQRISRARKICIAYKKAYESWIDDEAS